MADDADKPALARILARLGVVAELLSVPAGELLAIAALCGGGLGRFARISIDGRFERLSLLSALPLEPDRGHLLAELARRDHLFGERIEAWLERGDESYVELEQGGGDVALAVVTTGRRPLAADLDSLRARTHAGAAVDRLAELLAGLRESVMLVDRFRPPAHHSWELAARLDGDADDHAVLEPLAAALGIAAPQRGLLADMHPILARRRGVIVGVRAGPGLVYPELHLTYRHISAELLIRLLVGLEINRDPGEPLGRFLGALGAPEEASVLELVLADVAPPRLRLGVELIGGEPR